MKTKAYISHLYRVLKNILKIISPNAKYTFVVKLTGNYCTFFFTELKAYFHFNTKNITAKIKQLWVYSRKQMKTIWPMTRSQIYMSSEYFIPP